MARRTCFSNWNLFQAEFNIFFYFCHLQYSIIRLNLKRHWLSLKRSRVFLFGCADCQFNILPCWKKVWKQEIKRKIKPNNSNNPELLSLVILSNICLFCFVKSIQIYLFITFQLIHFIQPHIRFCVMNGQYAIPLLPKQILKYQISKLFLWTTMSVRP